MKKKSFQWSWKMFGVIFSIVSAVTGYVVVTERRLSRMEEKWTTVEREPLNQDVVDLRERVATLEGKSQILELLIHGVLPKGQTSSLKVPSFQYRSYSDSLSKELFDVKARMPASEDAPVQLMIRRK